MLEFAEVTERLRRDQELFAQIAEISPVCITKVNAEGQIVFANPQAERVLGIAPVDVEGRTYNAPEWRITDVDGKRYPEDALPFAVVKATLRPVRAVEHAIEWPDGRRRIVSINASPVFGDEGEFAGIVSVIQDITDRKEAERQREADLEAKQQLMRELNHRVKNNLSMVASLIDLKQQTLNPSVDLSDIRSQVSTIAYLHEKLYETDNVSTVQPGPYLEELLTEIFSFYQGPPVELTVDHADRSLPTNIATGLGLILNEIATNAMKHGFRENETPRFGVTLRREGSDFLVTTSQSGHPFPKEVTLDGAESSGLSLIEVLASQFNGNVELIRTPSTQFRIRIPI